MQTLFQKFNNIINPGFRYFSAESEEFQQGKEAFDTAIAEGDCSVFTDILEEESRLIKTSGDQQYAREIHFLIAEIRTEAWKHRSKTVELTNEESQFICTFLRAKGNDEPLVHNVLEKLK